MISALRRQIIRFLASFFIIISIISILSCDNTSFSSPFNRTENISSIISSPSKYNDKLVNVKGKVTESFIVFGAGYFIVNDSTGSIAVIPAKTTPKIGEEIRIRGMVKNAFVIGDKSLTVIMEEGKHS